MLKLPQISVIGEPRAYLEEQQKAIDKITDYSEKVSAAKSSWDKKNQNIFERIREALDSICPGARRCHYCEDSAADEVEHVWPKNFYPERTFVWQNYLFACGPCNGSNKRDQFAVFDAAGNQFDIVRGRNTPVTPPLAGNPLFIDPTQEDPTQYISLDLETGIFVPIHPKNSQDFKRAEYTIKILGLNTRDYLTRARRSAYGSYKDALADYQNKKDNGASNDLLNSKRKEISEKHHPSVWHEIKELSRSGIAHQQNFIQSPELYYI